MAEVLVSYEGRVTSPEGVGYSVQACGRPVDDNVWEGWLEFIPDDGSGVLRTRRETTQPNLQDLEYWASGLELVYREGALRRALTPEKVILAPAPAKAAAYDGPATAEPHAHRGPNAALDPHHIHASQGDEVLRQQLAALEPWQLRNVAIAHADLSEAEAEELGREELTAAILEAVLL